MPLDITHIDAYKESCVCAVYNRWPSYSPMVTDSAIDGIHELEVAVEIKTLPVIDHILDGPSESMAAIVKDKSSATERDVLGPIDEEMTKSVVPARTVEHVVNKPIDEEVTISEILMPDVEPIVLGSADTSGVGKASRGKRIKKSI